MISRSLADEASLGDGPLAGVPYGLKDLFNLKGCATHSSSVLPFLQSEMQAKDAQLVDYLNALGATCAAKTQMNEFAYGLSGENPHYGDCPHPKLPGCLSGGSSSGSAYMVATGCVPLAFGTDTGGSIRLPAAWCGIYGIRWVPDYLMDGGFPLAPSFDTMGWFTRTAADMRSILMHWFDRGEAATGSELSGSALIPEALLEPETFATVRNATWNWGLSLDPDLQVVEALLPACQKAFNVLQSREAHVIHADWLASHGELYDPAVRMLILRAEEWTDADVDDALETWDRVRTWFRDYFRRHDYLALPVCPGPSIPPSQASDDLREKTLRLTTLASLAQRPALTVPLALDGSRSVGMQFIFKDVDSSVPLALLKQCEHI